MHMHKNTQNVHTQMHVHRDTQHVHRDTQRVHRDTQHVHVLTVFHCLQHLQILGYPQQLV